MELKRFSRSAVYVLAVIVLFGTGCQGPKGAPMYDSASGRNAKQVAMAGGASASEASKTKAPAIGADAAESTDRYLIRNAILTIEAEDVRGATDRLIFAVRAAKGYVGNLQESVDGLGARSVSMEVRVPSSGFDRSMQELTALGKVLDKQVTAEDVTEEFVDTQSVLRNLKRTEGRLLEHLSKTGKLSDTLLIEKELTRVRQEIERNEGRMRFLSHRVAFSTINVTLRETARKQALVPPESFSTGQQVSDASRSLVEFLRGLWTMVIWVGIWAVVWLPIAVVLILWVRRERRKSQPARVVPPPITDNPNAS
jgi:hypothetical protein